MESLVNPKPWVPYMNTKDCSQGFCSLYCPQWCYMIFPPPPPIEFPDDNPGPNFSPLVIAIIGILASAFLLVSYYAIISKYCGSTDSPRRQQDHDPNEELEGNEDPSIHEPWHVANNGLDEALIKSITVCKYKKGDGLIEGTDCSVCLSEFEEDEGVRLLPKCSHAFHVICIDTWLKSHSNCPLCRTNIVSINPLPLPPPPPVSESPPNNESSSEITQNEVISEDLEMGVREEEETLRNDEDLKTDEKDTIIEIKDENYKRVRRSVSMDFVCQERVSVADVLLLDQDEDFQNDDGPSKELPAVGMTKSSNINRGLHTVNSPVAIKRSFSSGRFSFPKRGRVRNAMIPL